ncbi:hypothetical protein ACM66B_001103 [Microbotryomycetes sp. NB124-2]
MTQTAASIPSPTTRWLDRFVKLPNDVVHVVFASLLDECRLANDRLPTKGPITRWHAKVPSPIESATYIHRLTFFSPYPRDALLLSLWYMDRVSCASIPDCPQPTRLLPSLVESARRSATRSRARASPTDRPLDDPSSTSNKAVTTTTPAPRAMINSFTLHRLVLSTLLVASKFISDGAVPQTRAAKVGGVSTNELVRLEVEVLAALSWDLDFDLDTMEDVARIVLERARQMGKVEDFEEAQTLEETLAAEHAQQDTVSEQATSIEVETAMDERTSPPSSGPSSQATPRANLGFPIETNTEPATPLSVNDSDTSVTSSQTSSTAASPRLFDAVLNRDDLAKSSASPPPSPPSSAGYTSDEGCNVKEGDSKSVDESRMLLNRASTETVRRLQSLSVAQEA